MQEGLSLDQAPPFTAPLRFFLTAPVFGILAGIGLLIRPEILSSRWYSESIGTTHLLTLGFIAMSVVGAMMQMLPVLAGKTVKRPLLFAMIIHILLVSGTFLFVSSFFLNNFSLFVAALSAVFSALLYFFIYTASLIFKTEHRNDTITAMTLSLISLFIVITSGLFLGLNRIGSQLPFQIHSLADIHIAWALLGWAGILIFGVSYQVFPMFYIAPPLASIIKRTFLPVFFLLLIFWSVLTGTASPGILSESLLYLTAFLTATFSVFTLILFYRRKRKIKESALPFFQSAFAFLIISVLLFFFHSGMTGAILYLYGFAVTMINGMMYRIIPFLTFF
ncbi:MAG: hypothetical protein OEZ34_03410, partial [Spirochaetia bacterium]|nr:hypothetical protein [Spirochaetia bacterium]